jgi:Acyl-CoA synthetases (AMP-forming)/AMP-acid ligases II
VPAQRHGRHPTSPPVGTDPARLRALRTVGRRVTAGAIRFGDRTAIVDEVGELTYKQLDERSNAIANCWREDGLEPGEGVAILVRNHRGFFDAVFAAAKCGARVVLLNTSFAGPQIREVAEREGTDLLVYDDEYAEALAGIDDPPRGRYRAWTDAEGDDTLEALVARQSQQSAQRRAPRRRSRSSPAAPPAARRARRVLSPGRSACSAAC